MMHFIPKDTISIADIVEKVDSELHCENAIAEFDVMKWNREAIPFEMDEETLNQRELHLVRAGVEISEIEDAERWDGAAEEIRLSLLSGELTAYVTTMVNLEKTVPK